MKPGNILPHSALCASAAAPQDVSLSCAQRYSSPASTWCHNWVYAQSTHGCHNGSAGRLGRPPVCCILSTTATRTYVCRDKAAGAVLGRSAAWGMMGTRMGWCSKKVMLGKMQPVLQHAQSDSKHSLRPPYCPQIMHPTLLHCHSSARWALHQPTFPRTAQCIRATAEEAHPQLRRQRVY